MKHLIGSGIASRRTTSPAKKFAFALALCCFGHAALAEETDARKILASMSTYVAGQGNIELSFDSDIEVVTTQLEKIQFTSSGGVQLSRPNRLHAFRTGGYADVELFFDGKTASVLGRNLNAYAQFDAPGNIDQLIHALRSGHGVALPGADLLLSNSFDVLIADVEEAKYIGRGVVGGVECEHLAFRNADTDWQLWVEVGDRPIPRKMVITSKTITGAPQYTVRITSWKSGGRPSASRFTFVPAKGMAQLQPDALIDLDELPQDAAAGEAK
jgi:hypothetical protein